MYCTSAHGSAFFANVIFFKYYYFLCKIMALVRYFHIVTSDCGYCKMHGNADNHCTSCFRYTVICSVTLQNVYSRKAYSRNVYTQNVYSQNVYSRRYIVLDVSATYLYLILMSSPCVKFYIYMLGRYISLLLTDRKGMANSVI
jgi:hypothetical protein